MRSDVDIFLVRHGESVWNSRNLVQGQSPHAPGLTTVGKKQAVALARTLGCIDSQLVISSDLSRAVETGLPIANVLNVPLKTDPRLRERGFGVLEGSSNEHIESITLGIDGTSVTNIDAKAPGGESLRDFYARIADFFSDEQTLQSDRPIVVVTHGGVVRMAIACLSDAHLDNVAWIEVPNASITKIAKRSHRQP
ncbi:MAG: histidine phosphatase family protein [Acidimicrobiales bacterium]